LCGSFILLLTSNDYEEMEIFRKTENFLIDIDLVIISFQIIVLILVYYYSRSSILWILSVISYILPFYFISKSHSPLTISSIVLLFLTQHSIILSAQPYWGYGFGSDSINDLHIASVVMEQEKLVLGQTGYGRTYYSYFPFLHIYTVMLSKISGISVVNIAKYFIPLLNSFITPLILFALNKEIGLDNEKNILSILIFSLSWYYALFHSNFIREVYAFPICLILLYSTIKILKRDYIFNSIFYLMYLSLVYTHQFSTYLIILNIIVIAFGYYLTKKSTIINLNIISMFVLMLVNSIYIYYDLTRHYIISSITALFGITERGSLEILPGRASINVQLTLSYYLIVGILTLLGSYKLYFSDERKKYREYLPFLFFCLMLFGLSVLLRVSASGEWAYYMSRRGTIWAFLGMSIIMTYGLDYVKKIDSRFVTQFISIILIVLILSLGKVSQYPLHITNSELEQDVRAMHYESAIWLNEYSEDGSWMLVQPKGISTRSRNLVLIISTYAYLRQHYLYWMPYVRFEGYIPFVSSFYDQYLNQSDVAIIYSNGDVMIGYRTNPIEYPPG